MSVSFDDNLLAEGSVYTVGTNDGKEFQKVIFVGYKLMNGKPIMVFSTEETHPKQITINPSFHTFTMEEEMVEHNHITFQQAEDAGEQIEYKS